MPAPTITTAELLHRRYEQQAADWRRDHLGASGLGHKCDRQVWLSFRWAGPKGFDGRMERLLERGNREEAWIVDDLRAIGCTVEDVDPATGKQWRVRWGHVGGSCDGIITGLVENPDVRHLLECKTSNAKQFAKLQDKGVRRAKPEHWTQMQCYMLGLGLDVAFYIAVCKDDDSIYTEFVPFDRKAAEKAIARAQAIAIATEPPARQYEAEFPPCVLISKDGTRWPCEFHEQCHGEKWPERSCRTCIKATPGADGTWHCSLHDKALDSAEQRAGCGSHLTIPSMVNAQVVEADEQTRRVVYQTLSGGEVVEEPQA